MIRVPAEPSAMRIFRTRVPSPTPSTCSLEITVKSSSISRKEEPWIRYSLSPMVRYSRLSSGRGKDFRWSVIRSEEMDRYTHPMASFPKLSRTGRMTGMMRALREF